MRMRREESEAAVKGLNLCLNPGEVKQDGGFLREFPYTQVRGGMG